LSAVHSEGDVQNQADICDIDSCQILKDGYEVQQFVIVRVGKPTADGHSMLGVEDVGSRRVIDDDCVLKISSDLREIFDIISLVVVAALSEEPVVDHLVNIQLIQQRVAVLKANVSRRTRRSTERCQSDSP
jgi:hypothetical protein